MSSEDVAVRVLEVSKHYLLFNRSEDRLKQMIVPRLERLAGLKPTQYYRDFAALSGISFDVQRGEMIGIVGRNGSGKSTLLQIICGTLNPTSGGVEVNGRVAALLELGAGFNPELTGRENVYMNAAILGLTRAEVDERFDSIARFADIGAFIEQPVMTYSSGMYVRLAFATAINVDADIIVVDEALAVGDEAFQRKCYARIEELKAKGCTILFVSHGAQTIVQLCDRAILIDAGAKILEGRPKHVVSQYQRLVNLTGEQAAEVREEIMTLGAKREAESSPGPTYAADPTGHHNAPDRSWFDSTLTPTTTVAYEEAGGRIESMRILSTDGRQVNVLQQNQTYRCRYEFVALTAASDISFGFLIKTIQGVELTGANTDRDIPSRIAQTAIGERIAVEFEFTCRLREGVYFANAGALGTVEGDRRFLHRVMDALAFRVLPQLGSDLDYGYFSMEMRFTAHRTPAPSDIGSFEDGRTAATA